MTSVYWAHGARVTTLPDTLLFPFGSSALVLSADTVLRPLAQRASSQHLLVSIIGTASPDGGSSTFNYHLSVAVQRPSATGSSLWASPLARSHRSPGKAPQASPPKPASFRAASTKPSVHNYGASSSP